jgi:hypothetical protein
MNENTYPQPSFTIGRIAVLVILISLGLRVFQIALGDAPTVQAAEQRALLRVEWLARCGVTTPALGLFAATDAPCLPGKVVSLNWLQGQLTAGEVLKAGEYLEWRAHPAHAACNAVVLNGAGTVSGWMCADLNGLYRLGADGGEGGARWQVWSTGEWASTR